MSKPQNILTKYRTYSYHHILIACNNEAAAEYIRTSNELSVFRDLSVAIPVSIAEEDKKIDVNTTDQTTGKIDRTEVGSYVVILNGMIDTAFVIKDVEWFTMTAISTDVHDKHTSIAVEGKMTVEEPRGVRFMNALNGACDLLESDPTGVIWMLKTIFVGHRDNPDNVSDNDYITDLRPLEFMLYDVTGTFDITGGVYELSFAGVANGASRFPQFSRIAQHCTIPVGDGNLANAFTFLQNKMNTASANNRDCVIEALKNSYGDSLGETGLGQLENFRLVEYEIVLDSPYSDDSGVSPYVITGTQDQQQDIVGEESSAKGTLKFGPQATVEQVIRAVMNRVNRVDKDRTEGDENGIKYIFKIHSEITMVGKGTRHPITQIASEKDIILVVYRIRRHAEMTNETVERVLAGDLGIDGEAADVTADKIRENTLEFDYFFTGKNTDILDFDLKMDMGLAFLQTLASTNNIGSGTNQIAGTETENIIGVVGTEAARANPAVSAEGEMKEQVFVRSRTPIFPATNVNNVYTKNIRGVFDSTMFQAFLSRHAALESVEANITIHGNPYLMSSTNRKPSDTERRGNTSDEEDVTNIMQNWEFMPGLAKINIFMPATNATPSSTDSFRREQFWYDGHYYIYGIDHKFNDGQFTQNLHLLSLPNKSLLDIKQKMEITECGGSKQQGAAGEASESSIDSAAEGSTEAEVLMSESTNAASKSRRIPK